MKDRTHNLVVRVDRTELLRLHALAEDADMPMATFLRRLVRQTYETRFGTQAPPERELRGERGGEER